MSGKSSHWFNNVSGVVPIAKSVCKNKVHPKKHILKILFDILSPKQVIEFGCGKGGWIMAAKSLGAQKIIGYDIPEIDISERAISEEEFVAADLSKRIEFVQRYDLAISTEVAEHISSEFSDLCN